MIGSQIFPPPLTELNTSELVNELVAAAQTFAREDYIDPRDATDDERLEHAIRVRNATWRLQQAREEVRLRLG